MCNAALPSPIRNTLSLQWLSNEFLANKRTELVSLSLALFDLSEYGLLKDLIATANNHHTCNKNQGFCSPLSPILSYLFSHTFQFSRKKKGLWDITSQSEYSFPSLWQTSRVQCSPNRLTFRSLALLFPFLLDA